jgi:hypothetical protein
MALGQKQGHHTYNDDVKTETQTFISFVGRLLKYIFIFIVKHYHR